MANVQKPGSAQRNIPSSKPFRTDIRINYANFFGIYNWKHGDINTGVSSLPETSSLTENDVIVSIWFTLSNNTSQQDFGTRKFFCVSNVTFHVESKYAIKIFPSPTVFVQWSF